MIAMKTIINSLFLFSKIIIYFLFKYLNANDYNYIILINI